MKDLARNKTVPCVGVTITDRQIQYLELETQEVDSLLPQQFGTVGIAYDAVEQGEIINTTEAAAALKRLYSRVDSRCVVVGVSGDSHGHEQWKELLMIAGFGEVIMLPVVRAWSHLLVDTQGQGFGVLQFVSQSEVVVHTHTQTSEIYAYPFDVDGVIALQDICAQQGPGPLMLVGDFPEDPHIVQQLMGDYGIDTTLPNVWTQCFDVSEIVPALTYEESFAYAPVLALAHYGARYSYDPGTQEIFTSVVEPLAVVEKDEHHTEILERTGELGSTAQASDASQHSPTQLKKDTGDPYSTHTLHSSLAPTIDASLHMTPEQGDDAHQVPVSAFWLRDADEMIYGLFRKR